MSSISLMDSLQVKATNDPDVFHSTTLWRPRGARGVFGGHVIALALVAAGKTVSAGMGLHSQHCYFVLPADPLVTIEFKVERTRDGKSYGTRVVRALQKGKTVFVLAASYARAVEGEVPGQTPFSFIPSTNHVQKKAPKQEAKLSHSLRFAVGSTKDSTKEAQEKESSNLTVGGDRQEGSNIPPFSPRWFLPFPDGVSSFRESILEEVRWSKFLDKKAGTVDENAEKYIAEYIEERKESPVCIAVARRKIPQPSSIRMIWMQARITPSDKPSHEDVKAMIGYMTDFQFIGTAARSVGLTSASSPRLGMLATLDHTTHYYPFPANFDPSRPMLHVMEAAITDVTSGRGIVRGLLYTEDGVLIAVTSQEGVVRAYVQKKERGVVEGGGFEGEAKAKL